MQSIIKLAINWINIVHTYNLKNHHKLRSFFQFVQILKFLKCFEQATKLERTHKTKHCHEKSTLECQSTQTLP